MYRYIKFSLTAILVLLSSGLLLRADYGQEQLKHLLQDRPELRVYIYDDNPIQKWIVQAFNSPNNGYRVTWDASPTSSFNPFGAESDYDVNPNICRIRVDETYREGPYAGLKRQPEEILYGLVFELCNVQSVNLRLEDDALAFSGELSKNHFIINTAHQEYLASKAAQEFNIDVFIPYCTEKKLPHNDGIWPFIPKEFSAWLNQYPEGSYYPWVLYGNQYDKIIAIRKNSRTPDSSDKTK